MFKALTPIFAIIIAIGLAVTYVSPTFVEIKEIQDETRDYEAAIGTAQQLRDLVAEKVARLNSFNQGDLEDLELMIPENVDEVSLIMDIDALARASNMVMSDIQISTPDGKELDRQRIGRAVEIDPANPTAAQTEDVPNYIPTDVAFTITGTYEDMRTFVANLEQSLVLIDITKLNFEESEGDLTSFSMTVRAYAFSIEN